ncbi:MAG TPA: hypothetical protein VGD45_20470 [Steroidobacter sp.]|uniref:hypothetical protein n=1 Tax=Steroidobacter sp. TaxID=1978227 RepID=UPI002ED82ACF
MTDILIMLAPNGLPGRFFIDRREISGVTACSVEQAGHGLVVVNLSIAPMDFQIVPPPKHRRAPKMQARRRAR